MPARAAIFLGKGKRAKCLLDIPSDGYPEEVLHGDGVPRILLRSTCEEEFRMNVNNFYLRSHSEGRRPNSEISWQTVRGYNYIYSFFSGHVWITTGSRWFNPFIRAKRPTSPPPAPITRKGKIEGELTITCGECGRTRRVTARKFMTWLQSHKWDIETAKVLHFYFEEEGFKKTRPQGWLCSKCAKIHEH